MNDAAGDMIIFLFDDLPLLILDHLTIKVGPESKSIAYDSHPQAPTTHGHTYRVREWGNVAIRSEGRFLNFPLWKN